MKLFQPFLLAFFVLVSFCSSAQTENACGTGHNHPSLKSSDPQWQLERQEYVDQMRAAQNNPEQRSQVGNQIFIPVVIHVLHANELENITDEFAVEIIEDLNDDLAKLNADTIDIPAVWQSVAANTNIQFCLAAQDPEGFPTTGVERRLVDDNTYDGDDVKSFNEGGLDAWDVSRYFNIWVCDIEADVPTNGYAEFPGSTLSDTYGVVIEKNFLGYGSRTLTHEVGHCLNLEHIWGALNGSGCNSDFVDDTPTQQSFSGGCFTFPFVDICSEDDNGRMFMNYMDYGDCRVMFTEGQSFLMNYTFTVPPYDVLLNSNGCEAPQQSSHDIRVAEIAVDVCNINEATPIVTIQNLGEVEVTSFDLTCTTNGSNPITTSHNVNLIPLGTVDITTSGILPGNQTINLECSTSLPNGLVDGMPANDSGSLVFQLDNQGDNVPAVSGFESTTFPPDDWVLFNDLAAEPAAERTTDAASVGNASMRIDRVYLGQTYDLIEMDNYNLSASNAPEMSFDIACRLQSDPSDPNSDTDSLFVDVSTDCKETWQTVYHVFSTGLATVPGFSFDDFIPEPDDWRTDYINLSDYSDESNVYIRFRMDTDTQFGEMVYIDNIRINQMPTSVDDLLLESDILLFPNPTNGALTISVENLSLEVDGLVICNILGEQLLTQKILKTGASAPIRVDLSSFSTGIYFIQLTSDGQPVTKSEIISRH